MASIDFTTVEVWTKGGLTTFYLLFVMELKTRRVNFAGCTTHPNEAWMKTIALELTNHEDGFLKEKSYYQAMDGLYELAESLEAADTKAKPTGGPLLEEQPCHYVRCCGSYVSHSPGTMHGLARSNVSWTTARLVLKTCRINSRQMRWRRLRTS